MELHNLSGQDEWVIIGIIVKAHGIKGSVKVLPQTETPDRFKKGTEITVRLPGKSWRRLTVNEVRQSKGLFYIFFNGIDSRTEAEELRGAELVVSRDEVPPLPPGNYYIFEVIGMQIVNERGEMRGIVKDIYTQTAYDIYAVEWNEREFLIPAVQEFISKIDRQKRQVHIREQDGLFE